MRTNHISKVTEIIILVATVIVVCIITAIGFKITNEGKSAVMSGTNNFNNMTSQYSDIDKAIYDGATVQGSEVSNLIKKVLASDEYLSIVVNTKSNIESKTAGTEYNYDFTEPADNTQAALSAAKNDSTLAKEKGDANYINESAQFLGKVYKDANDIIICIEFTQV